MMLCARCSICRAAISWLPRCLSAVVWNFRAPRMRQIFQRELFVKSEKRGRHGAVGVCPVRFNSVGDSGNPPVAGEDLNSSAGTGVLRRLYAFLIQYQPAQLSHCNSWHKASHGHGKDIRDRDGSHNSTNTYDHLYGHDKNQQGHIFTNNGKFQGSAQCFQLRCLSWQELTPEIWLRVLSVLFHRLPREWNP